MTDRNEVANHEKLIKEAATAIRDARTVTIRGEDGSLSVAQADDETLARAALAVFEKARTPTDDEWEALAQAIRDSLGVTPETIAAGHQRPGNTDDLARDLLARGFGFRRSEVPEPSADHMDALSRIDQATAYIRASWLGMGEPTPNTPAGEIIAILRGVRTFTPEPQGEPSDAEIEAARYRERLGDLEGADDEVLAHTRTIAERAQGEPSDAPTVQFVARKGGKSQALIDQMLAQANGQGIRVEVVYPQDEPSFEVPEPSADFRELAEQVERFRDPAEPKCEHGTSLSELCEHVERLVNAEPQGEPSEAQVRKEVEYRVRTAVAYGMGVTRRDEIFNQRREAWVEEQIEFGVRALRAAGFGGVR